MRNDIAPIIIRFGQWAVTEYGVECVDEDYSIARERVHESDWADHLVKKPWCNMNDFQDALDEARRLFKNETLKTGKASWRTTKQSKRFLIMRRDEFRCQLCGASSQDGARLEIDHKVPVAHGGTDEDANLWTLCSTCNKGKTDMPL